MGKRSRKRSSQPAAAKPRPAARPKPAKTREEPAPMDAAPAREPSRSEAKDAAARAALVPLAEGERPRAVTWAALYALGLALVQVVLVLAGERLEGNRSQYIGPGLFVGILLVAAWGCWTVRYWAVLGMQALLALMVVFFSLASTRANAFVDWVIVVWFVGSASVLFWYLVKAMARIQMPERGPR